MPDTSGQAYGVGIGYDVWWRHRGSVWALSSFPLLVIQFLAEPFLKFVGPEDVLSAS
jgi:hypothetical protein